MLPNEKHHKVDDTSTNNLECHEYMARDTEFHTIHLQVHRCQAFCRYVDHRAISVTIMYTVGRHEQILQCNKYVTLIQYKLINNVKRLNLFDLQKCSVCNTRKNTKHNSSLYEIE